MQIFLCILLLFFAFPGTIFTDGGWHLLGGLSGDPSSFFLANPSVDRVWGFEDGEWKVAEASSPSQELVSFPVLDLLSVSRGYWVSSSSGTFSVNSTGTSQISTYPPGYHLISGTGQSAADFLADHPEISLIWSYSTSGSSSLTSTSGTLILTDLPWNLAEKRPQIEDPRFPRFQNLQIDKAYWIRSDWEGLSYSLSQGGTARERHSASLLGSNIYFFGGLGGGGTLNTIDVYEISTGTWSTAPPSGISRRDHSAIIFNGLIYYFGGRSESSEFISSLQSFDPIAGIWQDLGDAPSGRHSHAAFLSGDSLYVWGGQSESSQGDRTNSMDQYIFSEDRWVSSITGGIPREGHVAALVSDQAYMIGGNDRSMDRFHIQSDVWLPQVGLDTFFSSGGFAHMDDRVILSGGLNTSFSPGSVISELRPPVGQIVPVGSLLEARQFHSSVAYEGKIFSWGGRNSNRELLNSLEVLVLSSIDTGAVNQSPAVTNLSVSGNDSLVLLALDLQDQNGDPGIRLTPQFSLDSGATWKIPKRLEGQLEGLRVGQGIEFSWYSSEDFLTDETDIDLRVLATDGRSFSSSALLTNTSIYNGIPQVQDLAVEGKSGNVEISFFLSDRDGDPIDTLVDYSLNEGVDWSPITSGSLSSLAALTDPETSPLSRSQPGFHLLTWNTLDAFGNDQLRVRVRVTPTDRHPRDSNVGVSDLFGVFNGANNSPRILSVEVLGRSSTIPLNVSALDLDGDLIKLGLEISLDQGLTWSAENLVQNPDREYNPGETILVDWDSTQSIQQDLDGVLLRFTPDDGKLGSSSSLNSIPFPVFNSNREPMLETFNLFKGSDGKVQIGGSFSDANGDQLNLRFLFRSDSGSQFLEIPPFHLEGKRTDLSSTSTFLVTWYSTLDFEGGNQSLQIQVQGFDGKESSTLTTPLALDISNSGVWRSGASGGVKRSNHLGKRFGNTLLFFGGADGSTSMERADTFDFGSGQWSSSRILGTNLTDTAGEIVSGLLYLWGGRSSLPTLSVTNALLSYNPSSEDLLSIGATGTPRYSHSSVVFEGKIYFLGGKDSQNKVLDSLMIFDPGDSGWAAGAPMRIPRAGHSAALVGHEMVVWGGESGSSHPSNATTVPEILNLETGVWRKGTPSPRYGASATASSVGNRVYFAGGLIKDDSVSPLELASDTLVYRVDTDTWLKAPPPLRVRRNSSLLEYLGNLYLWGGVGSDGLPMTQLEFYQPPSLPSSLTQSPTLVQNLKVQGSTANIQFQFDLLDQLGSLLDLSVELSYDSGLSWSQIESLSLGGSLRSVIPTTGITLVWNSLRDVHGNRDDLRVRISAVNPQGGLSIPGLSPAFPVYNDSDNSAPIATNVQVTGARNLIQVNFSLEDPDEGDLLNVGLEYSSDSGLRWIPTDNISGILTELSGGDSHVLTWESSLDFSQVTTDLKLRITASDGRFGNTTSNPLSESSTFTLYNGNLLPFSQVVELGGTQDDLMITFDLFDQDLDLLSINFEYSLGESDVWIPSTNISGISTSSISPGTYTLTWSSLKDIQSDEGSVRVRIVPFDQFGIGFPTPSTPFVLPNENYAGIITIDHPRVAHTALYYDNRIFYWGGENEKGEVLNSLDIFDLNTFTWSSGSPGGEARKEHAGVAHSGRLYFWGGKNESNALVNTLDIYDINADLWTSGGFGGSVRSAHSAVVFDDQIFFWGGRGVAGEINSMDVYDILQGTWSIGNAGGSPRADHAGVRVGDLYVIWGGVVQQSILNNVDIYNLRTGVWSQGISGGRHRFGHTGIGFDGLVYFWGGLQEAILNSLDVYDPGSDSWIEGDGGGTARTQHTAVENQGRVYFFGGSVDGKILTNHEVYSIPGSTSLSATQIALVEGWNSLSSQATARTSHFALEQDGRVFNLGGYNGPGSTLSNVQSYSAQDLIVDPAVTFPDPRAQFAALNLDGDIYFFGGLDSTSTSTNSVLIYHTTSETFSYGLGGGVARYGHMAGDYRGSVYLFGGKDSTQAYSTDLDIFEVESGTWLQSRGGGMARAFGSLQPLDGRLYFWGGEDGSGIVTNSLEIYDVEAGVFFEGSPGGIARKHHSAFSHEGEIYFWGGLDQSGTVLDSVDIYSVSSGTWSSGPAGGIARHSATLTRVSQKAIAFGGTDINGTILSDAYEFIPSPRSGVSWKQGSAGGRARALHTGVQFQKSIFQWGGLNADGGLNQTDILDLRTRTWSAGTTGGRTRWDHSAALHNGSVYYYGGSDDSNTLASMDIHHLPGRRLGWLQEPQGPSGRGGAVAAAFQDKLYVFSGRLADDTLPLNIEIYDTVSRSWQPAVTPTGFFVSRERASAVLSGSTMLIFGGKTGIGSSDELLELDLVDLSIASGPIPGSNIGARYDHEAILNSENMLVIGGRTDSGALLSSIGEYDLNAGWSLYPAVLSTGLASSKALLSGEKVYIYAGESSSGVTDSLQILDLKSLTITVGKSSGNPRKNHSGAIVGSLLYYWGGENDSGPVGPMDIYDLSSSNWVAGPVDAPRASNAAEVTNAKRIYSFGGENQGVTEDSLSVFLPQAMNIVLEAGIFSEATSGGTSRSYAAGDVFEGDLYFHGGIPQSGTSTNVLDVYDPVSDTWSSRQASTVPRSGHSVHTANGKIFSWGGRDETSAILNTLEFFDPGTQVWSLAPSGGTSRVDHASAVSGNRIYFWGGNDGVGNLNSVDIYVVDPWYAGPSGGRSRTGHTGVSYNSKLYFWGGQDSAGTALDTQDIFDSTQNSWSTGAPGGTSRYHHSGTVIEDKVYYWGGQGSDGTLANMDRVDIYRFLEDRWDSTGGVGGRVRSSHSAVTYDSKIYFWGGKDSTGVVTSTLDIYDPDAEIADRFNTQSTSGGTARFDHTAIAYQGKIYFWGGKLNAISRLDTMDIYDIASDSWSTGTLGGTERSNHSAVLVDGKIHYFGGTNLSGKLSTVDIYDIASDSWLLGPPGLEVRSDHSSSLVSDVMYAWGGRDSQETVLNSLVVYPTDQWLQGSSGGTARSHASVSESDGKLFFWGGDTLPLGGNSSDLLDIYDIGSDSWSSGLSGGGSRREHVSLELDGKIYHWGGLSQVGEAALDTLDIYDIASKSWSSGFSGGRARSGHIGLVTDSGFYFWGGNDLQGNLINTMEFFSPSSASAREWVTGIDGLDARYGHSATLHKGKIYIYGGKNSNGDALNTLSRYDIGSQEWTDLGLGGNARWHHAAGLWNDQIYFWGGEDSSGALTNTLDIYDLGTDSWMVGSSGGTPREGHRGSVFDGRFYFWGGFNVAGSLNLLDIYHIESDSWSTGISGGRSRISYSAVQRDGFLYAWGGQGSGDLYFNTLDILDLRVSENEAPTLSNLDLKEVSFTGYQDDLDFNLNLSDADLDAIALAVEYSKDGGSTWFQIDPAHLVGQITNLNSVQDHQIIWKSYSDVVEDFEDVKLRVSASDGQDRSMILESQPFLLSNSGTWLPAIPAPSQRSNHSLTFFSGRDVQGPVKYMIVWGGYDKFRNITNTLEFFNITDGFWFSGIPGPTEGAGRVDHDAVVYSEKVYHWGGRDSSGPLNTFSVYDVPFGAWRPLEGIPGGTARSSHTCSLVGNKMLVWGGLGTTGLVNKLDIYDFVNETWSQGNPGGTPRYEHSALVVGAKIYFYGGRGSDEDSDGSNDFLDTLEIYDSQEDSWTNGASLRVGLESAAAAVVDSRIYVWGGNRDGSPFQRDLYVYNIDSNTWQKAQSGGTGRRYHAGDSSDGILYFHGGFNGDELDTLERFQIPKP